MRDKYLSYEARRARQDVEAQYAPPLSLRASIALLIGCGVAIVALVVGLNYAKDMGWLQ